VGIKFNWLYRLFGANVNGSLNVIVGGGIAGDVKGAIKLGRDRRRRIRPRRELLDQTPHAIVAGGTAEDSNHAIKQRAGAGSDAFAAHPTEPAAGDLLPPVVPGTTPYLNFTETRGYIIAAVGAFQSWNNR